MRQLNKELRTKPKIKKKIMDDIRSDIEVYIENGKTMEQIVEIIGTPKEIANDFNRNYPEYRIVRQKKKIIVFMIVCVIISLACLLLGVIGRNIFFAGGQMSSVGGVDLPTRVIVAVDQISTLAIYNRLIKFSFCVFGVVIICAGYLVIKTKKKGGRDD